MNENNDTSTSTIEDEDAIPLATTETVNDSTTITISEDITTTINNTVSTLTSRTTSSRHAKNKAVLLLTNWKQQQKEARNDMLDRALVMYLEAVAKVGDAKNVSLGTISKICSTFGNPTWMNRNAIYYHYKK
jgi:uncharacterized membrane protein